jgi:hypothetical protein
MKNAVPALLFDDGALGHMAIGASDARAAGEASMSGPAQC